jgi:hypothetical protein
MQRKLRERILRYAEQHRHIPKWKSRMYAILWGASLFKLNQIGKEI